MSRFYTYVGVDRLDGGHVLHVYYDDAGVRHEDAVKFQPMLGKRTTPKEGKEYQYKDIYGNPLQWKRFENIDKYRHFISEYDEVDFYGTMKEDYQFLSEEYPDAVDYDLSMVRPFLIDIETDSSEGFTEVEDHKAAITAIALKDRQRGMYYVMSTKPWDAKNSCLGILCDMDLKNVKFWHCKTEEDIFKRLRKVIKTQKPDMLIGFYSRMFDFPYIIKRGEYVMGKPFMAGLSPWKRVGSKKKSDSVTGKIIDYHNEICGIPLLDFRDMYMKFVYTPRESYSLDFLATEELGETKLDYSEYDSLHDMWTNDPQKYIDYNIYDVELIDLMDQKLGLIDLTCTIAYYAKTNYIDTLGTVGVWDSIFFNTLKKDNVMIPPKHTGTKERYAGAYVFEPKTDIHEWLISVDLKSLYPHIQQQYNISPESIIEGDHIEDIDIECDLDDRFLEEQISGPTDHIMAANGCFFRKDKEGIVPGLLREIYSNRTVFKKKMIEWKVKLQAWKEEQGISVKQEFDKYTGTNKDVWADFNKKISKNNNLQMAMKILMNSEYGALANVHFRYYDIRLASAITLCAQLALKWAAKRIMDDPMRSKYKYELLYGDTDSLYISVKHVVDQIKMRRPDITDQEMVKQVNGFVAKIIQPIITKGYEDLAKYVNANENRMFMNHEKTITKALWTSKKRYALNVLWDEGVTYDEPKLSVKGIEIVRSSTPKVCRAALKESVALLLKDENLLLDHVKDFKKKFKTFEVAEVASPRSANNIDKFQIERPDGSIGFISKTPIAVRAALVYNNLVANHLEGNNFPMINSGEKIKYVYLRMPNDFDQNVIGFIRRLPEEAVKYIDWDLQFEKTFMSVIENIYQKMGKEFRMCRETNLSDIF